MISAKIKTNTKACFLYFFKNSGVINPIFVKKNIKTGSSNKIETPSSMFVIKPICDSKVKLFSMASVI